MGKKVLSAVICVLACASVAIADERELLNIKTPSALDPGESDFLIVHRFIGNVFDQPLENLLGIQLGANVDLAYRHMIADGFELGASYTFFSQELTVGASYVYAPSSFPLAAQIDAQYFLIGTSSGGVFIAVSAQTNPLFGFLSPTLVVGYDSYYNRVGFGAGALVTIAGTLSAIIEVFPPFGIGGTAHQADFGSNPSLALGLRLDTAGHNFELVIGNNYQIGERRLMVGAIPGPAGSGIAGSGFLSSLYLGFNIHRRFEF